MKYHDRIDRSQVKTGCLIPAPSQWLEVAILALVANLGITKKKIQGLWVVYRLGPLGEHRDKRSQTNISSWTGRVCDDQSIQYPSLGYFGEQEAASIAAEVPLRQEASDNSFERSLDSPPSSPQHTLLSRESEEGDPGCRQSCWPGGETSGLKQSCVNRCKHPLVKHSSRERIQARAGPIGNSQRYIRSPSCKFGICFQLCSMKSYHSYLQLTLRMARKVYSTPLKQIW